MEYSEYYIKSQDTVVLVNLSLPRVQQTYLLGLWGQRFNFDP